MENGEFWSVLRCNTFADGGLISDLFGVEGPEFLVGGEAEGEVSGLGFFCRAFKLFRADLSMVAVAADGEEVVAVEGAASHHQLSLSGKWCAEFILDPFTYLLHSHLFDEMEESGPGAAAPEAVRFVGPCDGFEEGGGFLRQAEDIGVLGDFAVFAAEIEVEAPLALTLGEGEEEVISPRVEGGKFSPDDGSVEFAGDGSEPFGATEDLLSDFFQDRPTVDPAVGNDSVERVEEDPPEVVGEHLADFEAVLFQLLPDRIDIYGSQIVQFHLGTGGEQNA